MHFLLGFETLEILPIAVIQDKTISIYIPSTYLLRPNTDEIQADTQLLRDIP